LPRVKKSAASLLDSPLPATDSSPKQAACRVADWTINSRGPLDQRAGVFSGVVKALAPDRLTKLPAEGQFGVHPPGAVCAAGRGVDIDDRVLSEAATSAPAETAPQQHWEQLAARVDPRLPSGQDWPLLADAISRAHASGYDVDGNLAGLAAASPLPERLPARELFWRLAADCQAARPPTRPAARCPEVFVPTHIRRPDERPPSVGPAATAPKRRVAESGASTTGRGREWHIGVPLAAEQYWSLWPSRRKIEMTTVALLLYDEYSLLR